jgi:hypothetical protein
VNLLLFMRLERSWVLVLLKQNHSKILGNNQVMLPLRCPSLLDVTSLLPHCMQLLVVTGIFLSLIMNEVTELCFCSTHRSF